jgi:hypothetical protein
MPRARGKPTTLIQTLETLQTAIRLGEQRTDQNLRLEHKLRKVKGCLYNIKNMIRSGRPHQAIDVIDYCIKIMEE